MKGTSKSLCLAWFVAAIEAVLLFSVYDHWKVIPVASAFQNNNNQFASKRRNNNNPRIATTYLHHRSRGFSSRSRTNFPSSSSSSSSLFAWLSFSSTTAKSTSSSSSSRSNDEQDELVKMRRRMSFLYEENYQDNNELLSYLPNKGKDLPPLTNDVLRRITIDYVYGSLWHAGDEYDRDYVPMDDILEAIEEEHHTIGVPVAIIATSNNHSVLANDNTNSRSSNDNNTQVVRMVEEPDIMKFLSFALLHRLPMEIVVHILKSHCDSSSSDGDSDCDIAEFETTMNEIMEIHGGSWKGVSFPEGLGVVMKRKHVVNDRFSPTTARPKWLRRARGGRTAAAAQVATDYIQDALQNATAPKVKRMTREEFFQSLEEVLGMTSTSTGTAKATPIRASLDMPSTTTLSSSNATSTTTTTALEPTAPFFPDRNRGSIVSQRIKNAISSSPINQYASRSGLKQAIGVNYRKLNASRRRLKKAGKARYKRLKKAGRAGFLAYAFINFCIYTLGILWQWKNIPPHPKELPLPLQLSLSPGTTTTTTITSATADVGGLLFIISFKKFLKAFVVIYVGGLAMKLPRLIASVAMSPICNEILKWTQQKTHIKQKNLVLLLWLSLLVTAFSGVMTFRILTDMAVRRQSFLSSFS